MPRISIIIPTYNKAGFLDLTLSGFLTQEYKDFELIIINDGSLDNTEEVVEKYRKKMAIKYLYHTNSGRAKTRNKGLDHVSGDILIFSDDDRIPSSQFILEHKMQIDSNPDTVSIGYKYDILSCYSNELLIDYRQFIDILRMDSRNINLLIDKSITHLFTAEDILKRFDETMSSYLVCESSDNHSYIYDEYGYDLEGFYFGWTVSMTSNLALSCHNSIYRFDESFSGWGDEDIDYAYQLYANGYKFRFSRKAVNYHQVHTRKDNEMNELYRNKNRFCHKVDSVEGYLYARYSTFGNNPALRANRLYSRYIKSRDALKSRYFDLCKSRFISGNILQAGDHL